MDKYYQFKLDTTDSILANKYVVFNYNIEERKLETYIDDDMSIKELEALFKVAEQIENICRNMRFE